jgi:hypothetical protein
MVRTPGPVTRLLGRPATRTSRAPASRPFRSVGHSHLIDRLFDVEFDGDVQDALRAAGACLLQRSSSFIGRVAFGSTHVP